MRGKLPEWKEVVRAAWQNEKAELVEEPWNNETFTEVRVNGTDYHFNKTQALAVKYLWENKSASEKDIGEFIGSASDNYRLISTFRNQKQGGYVSTA